MNSPSEKRFPNGSKPRPRLRVSGAARIRSLALSKQQTEFGAKSMKVVGGTDHEEEPTREDDEAVARVLMLAGAGWGLGDIATDAERDPVWVIDILHEHRDAFAPGDVN